MKLRKRFGVVLVLAMLVSVLAMTMTASAAKKAKKTKISQKTATISVGKSVKLSVKNAKGKKVTWKSEDEDVAKVGSSGKVTGLAGGEATIVAKVGGKSYKCAVTVEAVKFDKLNKEEPRINLYSSASYADGNADAQDLFVGRSKYDLKANLTVYPAGLAVKWSTSDAKVATVENGVVKAVANGTCTVTAEATDGSGASDTVVIWVTSMGEGTNSTNPIVINTENRAEFDKYFAKVKVTTYLYDKDGKLLNAGAELKDAAASDYTDMMSPYNDKKVQYPAKDEYYYYLKDQSFDRRKSSAKFSSVGYKYSTYKVYLKDKDDKPVAKPIMEYKDTFVGQDTNPHAFDYDHTFPAADYREIKYKKNSTDANWETGSVQMFYSVNLAGKTVMDYNYWTTYYKVGDPNAASKINTTISDEVVNGVTATLYK